MKLPRPLAAVFAALAATAASAFPINPNTTIFEYQNVITGHYALLDGGDVFGVDRGQAGPGWERTGYQFNAVFDHSQRPDSVPVCRFYSPVNNSHFLTANPAECRFLQDTPSGWAYEGIRFNATAAGPACPTSQSPVFRVYNNRAAFHDVNHRYTPDAAVRDAMIAQGWIDEGVAFCTDSWSHGPQKTFEVTSAPLASATECASRVGPCVALAQLPAMPNIDYLFFPPSFVNLNNAYPEQTVALTGTRVDVRTARPLTEAPATIAQHSFVHMFSNGQPPFGLHIAPIDRTSGPIASVSPMYEFPGVAGAVDERLFPWGHGHDHALLATAVVKVPTIKRGDTGSHAYGGLVFQFADASSGHAFLATVQAYGTVPPGDFSGPDANGQALVSTVFRADPSFGERVAGDFAACAPESNTACFTGVHEYRFRIDRAGFERALQRARAIDPALSADAANYFVGQLRFHNEIFGDAELGATVERLQLDVFF
jgi:uncharacterized protein DUF5648